MSNLIEHKHGLTSHENQNSISIFADDVLSTIGFSNLDSNSEGSDLLSIFGLPGNNEGPAYDPTDENKNMSSGSIKPNFTNSIRVYNALGTSHDLHMPFIKFAQNQWGVEISANPDEMDSSRSDGLLAYADLHFKGDGVIYDIDFTPIDGGQQDQSVSITWANKANDAEYPLI